MTRKRGISAVVAASVLAVGVLASPAGAWEKVNCNSGNGNGSEEITFNLGEHCYGGDPGNSFLAGNRGGDEYPTAGGVANPGGNNVP